jgi:hypothetical protein
MEQKQNPSHPEALVLIRLKRDRAKQSIDQIVKRFGVISNDADPSLEVLLEYFTNMVYAIELLLKVMADDWKVPGKSRFGHRVGDMYEEVFGKPHLCAQLMLLLEAAIVNQKFILEPAEGLMERVPEMECLWDELTFEFYKRQWMDDVFVRREVLAPANFIQFLKTNLHRFFLGRTYTLEPPVSKEHRVQFLKAKIGHLQAELEKAEAGEEPPQETFQEQMKKTEEEYINSLEAAASCFELNCRLRNGRFSFGKWSFAKVLPGCLG